MAVRAPMTAGQFDALPIEEGRKWELLDGELIEVSSATPQHNRILLRLAALLETFARACRLGAVLIETDHAIGEKHASPRPRLLLRRKVGNGRPRKRARDKKSGEPETLNL